MARLTITWTPAGHGWAYGVVADDQLRAEFRASYITAAPEEFLAAVTGLVHGGTDASVQFEAEPTAFRWIFHRSGDYLRIRLLRLPDGSRGDQAGAEIWSSWQRVDAFARAVVRCFDRIVRDYGESGYRGQWGSPFPRDGLETLRTSCRQRAGNAARRTSGARRTGTGNASGGARRTFSEIVAAVKASDAASEPVRTAPGVHAGNTLIDPGGRGYRLVAADITAARAVEVAAAGAALVWDECGCGGGCGLDWFDAETVRRLAAAGAPQIRHTKRATGRMSQWRGDDGAALLFAQGAVRWGDRLA